jgi:hypothetical protein
MEKCHCVGIRFENVVEYANEMGIDYSDAARKLEVSEICRACRDDLNSYCENKKCLGSKASIN